MNKQAANKSQIEALEKELEAVKAAMVGGEIALSLYEHHAREEIRLLSEIKTLSMQITFHLD
tara:strand:+ start:1017 stop:1202 length:186 start_codon:yes stop_codon:yes gene_type:complete